jgi:molecular chaperone DnaK (HSP70)
MNIVGIDLGSSKIVIQKMTQTGPDIILSESSSRSMPNIISFSDN